MTFYRGESSTTLRYSYSTDGITWYGDQTLGNGAQSKRGTAAVVFNNRIFVFYRGTGLFDNKDIYFSQSVDGVNWSTDRRLGNGAASDEAPGVTVFNGRIYLVWKGQSDAKIWMSSSADGFTWGPQRQLFSGHFGTLAPPTAFTYDDRLYLFWATTSDKIAIYSSADGIGFEDFGNVSSGDLTEQGIGVTLHDEKVWLAFVGRDDSKVYVKPWDPVAGWQPTRSVGNAWSDERPSIVSDGTRMVVQWKSKSTNKNVFVTSTDGLNWSGVAPARGKTNKGGPYMIYTE